MGSPRLDVTAVRVSSYEKRYYACCYMG